MRSLTLKTKLFLAITSINVLIITLVAIMIYVSNVNEMRRQTESLSDVLAMQFTRTIDLYMQDIESVSISLFTNADIQQNLQEELWARTPYDQYLVQGDLYSQLFQQSYPRRDIEGITLFTEDNIAYEYTNQGQVEMLLLTEYPEWRNEINRESKGEFELLPTHVTAYSSGTEEQVISFVRNIYTIPQRERIGAMKIDMNINRFSDLLQFDRDNTLQEHLQLFVVDEGENLIFSNRLAYEGSELPDAPDVNAIMTGDNTFASTTYPSEYTGWETRIAIDDAFFLYERNQIIGFIATSGLIAVLLTALASYFIASTITRPMHRLVSKMKRVEEGELNERMEADGSPEIAVLSRGYNRMLTSIDRLISEVYEAKLTEKNAKIAALQAQINPHFLYNTLNVMKAIGRARGVTEVAEISSSLAELFKYNMNQSDQLVSLEAEKMHIEHYMRIQKHRFPNRYTLHTDIPEALRHALIPKLMIQPQVENSIQHGLKNLTSGGHIWLSAFEEEGALIIEIKDNGCGIEEARLTQVRQSLDASRIVDIDPDLGLGIVNTHMRLKLMFGETYGVSIQSELHQGTKVQLRMPLQAAEKGEGA
ncbi:cache domain-containing sensor histidine kinase [Alkalicoccus daliensis]|uniref:Histidine kinase-, DNA gyrase B-, and HSP90-like ATPase n=1 Tax=Alkalicoccus daliensis TaxID=745820 RepID=A0A1H0F2T8_9BACI|nr:sensor histidine kinase [Alkalicoccus daliensis]SDN88952.1 Histidine kinase-, DNA gyrase B-, and HSP90-like ATPase [Alkalicoccus daliensis]